MTDEVGYKNIDRVYALAREGKMSKQGDGKTPLESTLDLLALNMMVYMASKAIDKGDRKIIDEGKSYWTYWGGWTAMGVEMGLIPVETEQTKKLLGPEAEQVARLVETRKRTAINRLSRKARFLVERGCIKQLKPPIPLAQKNAVWLLLLGTDEEENLAAEYWARKMLHL